MKFLNPKTRWEPRWEATLDEMFEEIRFTRYTLPCPSTESGWLYLSTLGLHRKGGSDGWYHVKLRPALIDMLAPSIFSNLPELLHEELHADLVKSIDGQIRLYLQFKKVSGAYCLTVLDEAEVFAWLDRHKTA